MMPAPGTEKIPVEFPLMEPETPVYECPVCKALVTADGAQPHADWHSGEKMRNFPGF